MTVSEADFAKWQEWVGREQSMTERVEPVILFRYAAALGEPAAPDDTSLPSLAHWAFFLDAVQPGEIGPDGHPRRGGFLPPVSLPRRMFAASDIAFHTPLESDRPASQVARIAGLERKQGSSGDLVLLTLELDVEQGGRKCVSEKRTIIYRDDGSPTPLPTEEPIQAAQGDVVWQPGPVDLFRFSAVTFNSHRIHYDRPYATEVEGYPALVVQGPLTAARLFGVARKRYGPLSRFSFRAMAPLFVDQAVTLREDGKGAIIAIRCDGVEAMRARFEAAS